MFVSSVCHFLKQDIATSKLFNIEIFHTIAAKQGKYKFDQSDCFQCQVNIKFNCVAQSLLWTTIFNFLKFNMSKCLIFLKISALMMEVKDHD